MNQATPSRRFSHALLFSAFLQFGTYAAEPVRLLPFQGRLTDASGAVIADGPRLIRFQIFGGPSGGSPLWAGEEYRATVNGGLVNVMLGSQNPFPQNRTDDQNRSFFDTTLYLQITVDGNNDGKIDPVDSPLLPRQAILPVLFALDADRARVAHFAETVSPLVNSVVKGASEYFLPPTNGSQNYNTLPQSQVTITNTGRPVLLSLEPSDKSGGASFYAHGNLAQHGDGYLQFKIDGNAVSTIHWIGAITSQSHAWQPINSFIAILYDVDAGRHVYSFSFRPGPNSDYVDVNSSIRLRVTEL